MQKHGQHLLILPALIFIAGLIQGALWAAEQGDMQGWGLNDPYNQYYDINKFEKFRAWVAGFKTEPPMPGMSPGTIMIVRDGNRFIDVQICPIWFAEPGEIGVKKGDRVKIKGCRAKINGQDIFMASKVKKDDTFEFKVRLTKNGKPFWTMTPQELAGERPPENK